MKEQGVGSKTEQDFYWIKRASGKGNSMFDGVETGGTALPLYQQVLLVLLGPPIMTSLWWVMAGGLAKSKNRVVQNTTDRVAFLTILFLTYGLGISITIYAHFRRH